MRSELPINNLQELVAYAKENPGKLNFATPSPGTVHHLTWERFMQRTGAKFVHVPYQGGAQMVLETVAGRTQMFIENASAGVMAHVKSGALRMIAVTADRRSSQFPNISTNDRLLLVRDNQTYVIDGVRADWDANETIVTLHSLVVQ